MSLMFNFCRVTSLVCCVRDGIHLKKYGDKADLKSREKKFAISEGIPTFLDYWSYMYFCGACISGPWYEFKDFQNYMSGKENYKIIPNTLQPTLVRIFHVILMIAASIILSEYFDEKYYLT